MFFDEFDRMEAEREQEDQQDAKAARRAFGVIGVVLFAWLLVLVMSGQPEIRAQYESCIKAGGDTVICSVENGGP